MELWMKIGWAMIMIFMLIRLIPVAKDWLQNGPRGTSKEWLTSAMLLGGVAAFVGLLIMLVRGS